MVASLVRGRSDRMRVPILKLRDNLIVSITAALADADWLQLRADLAERVGQTHAQGVIVDVSALDVMDSFATRTLRTMVRAARLRGAEVVVVGVQPDVAFAMVQLGLKLDDVMTALDLDAGLDALGRTVEGGNGRGR